MALLFVVHDNNDENVIIYTFFFFQLHKTDTIYSEEEDQGCTMALLNISDDGLVNEM